MNMHVPTGLKAGELDTLSEIDLAQKFLIKHNDLIKYCQNTQEFYLWDGAAWRKDERKRVQNDIREMLEHELVHQEEKVRCRVGTAKTVSAVRALIVGHKNVSALITDWDKDPLLIGTPGGTVNLKTGHLQTAIPATMISLLTSVTPDRDATCPRWLKFLDESLGEDKDTIHFVQKLAGYCLTGLTLYHILAFLLGPGGNGKSVFINVLSRILGEYAKTSTIDVFLQSKHDKHSTDIAMLRGARLVTAAETEEGRPWAETKIKELTGGSEVTARYLYKDNFTFRPTFKLMIAGNHAPILTASDAMRRRIRLIEWTHRPEQIDPELEDKLMEEAPAILAWMIDGWLSLQGASDLTPSAGIIASTDRYFAESDPPAGFLHECVERAKGSRVSSKDIEAAFSEWARARGLPADERITSRLKNFGFAPIKGTAGQRYWRGLALRPDFPDVIAALTDVGGTSDDAENDHNLL